MRFLIVDAYYPAFLGALYEHQPKLREQPYERQLAALMAECFGTADFYSRNLQALGHEAAELVMNCVPLQTQWAKHHSEGSQHRLANAVARAALRLPGGTTRWLYRVLLQQIRAYRPDVLHIQDMNGISAAFLNEIRPFVGVITGQIASAIAARADFRNYDLVLSSFPHFVQQFQRNGLRSAYFQLGFEPSVRDHLHGGPTHDVVFVGGLSSEHGARIAFLQHLAESHRIDWWGYGLDNLTADSRLRGSYHGAAWGLDMYRTLATARITLNFHIEVARDYANNMRLYEATGAGSMLLTDAKRNLGEIFDVGSEVIAYESVQQCAELASHFLAHEEERAAVAAAGLRRTLAEHTYYHRMQEFIELVEPVLHTRKGRSPLQPPGSPPSPQHVT